MTKFSIILFPLFIAAYVTSFFFTDAAGGALISLFTWIPVLFIMILVQVIDFFRIFFKINIVQKWLLLTFILFETVFLFLTQFLILPVVILAHLALSIKVFKEYKKPYFIKSYIILFSIVIKILILIRSILNNVIEKLNKIIAGKS